MEELRQSIGKAMGEAIARKKDMFLWKSYHSVSYPFCRRRKMGHRKHAILTVEAGVNIVMTDKMLLSFGLEMKDGVIEIVKGRIIG